MIQGIIDELHKHGLSDLAQHLEIWQTYATEQQLKALCDSLEAARFNKRYTLGEVISR